MHDEIFVLFSVQTDLKIVIRSWGMIPMNNGRNFSNSSCIYVKKNSNILTAPF